MNRYSVFLVGFIFLSTFSGNAQDDLLKMLDSNVKPEINYTTASFKSTRILNGHSIERFMTCPLFLQKKSVRIALLIAVILLISGVFFGLYLLLR